MILDAEEWCIRNITFDMLFAVVFDDCVESNFISEMNPILRSNTREYFNSSTKGKTLFLYSVIYSFLLIIFKSNFSVFYPFLSKVGIANSSFVSSPCKLSSSWEFVSSLT